MFRFTALASVVAICLASSGADAQLVSHWRGEGNANDSVGANHRAAFGIVNYALAVVGQAFLFPDNVPELPKK